MNLTFAPQAWEDYTFWQATDPKMVSRINLLLSRSATEVRNLFWCDLCRWLRF